MSLDPTIQEEIFLVSKILNKGGVILYPTDTIWGLGCDATNAEAVGRVFQIKRRSPFKSMIILVDSAEMIGRYVHHPSEVLINAMVSANTPTTAIFDNAQNLPTNAVNEDDSIAIRIATDEFCKNLIRHFKKPIVSTSANISSKPTPANYAEISPILLQRVDYTVHYRRDDISKKAPSSIIRLNLEGEVEKLR